MAAPGFLDRKEFEVRVCSMGELHAAVAAWHYSKGGSNTATFRHGLYRKGDAKCLGIAWWVPPIKPAAIANCPHGTWQTVLALSRLAIDPSIPQNGATFLMGKSIREIRKDGRFCCLLTYADDWQGHAGTIYRAGGWTEAGRTSPESTWQDQAGRMVARKAGGRTRTKGEMEQLGFKMIGRFAKTRFTIQLKQLPKSKSET